MKLMPLTCFALFAAIAPACAQDPTPSAEECAALAAARVHKDPNAIADPRDSACMKARLDAARQAAADRLAKSQAELEAMKQNAARLPPATD
ncbi:hypothetical protein [Hyphomicrobium sp. MC8b]|uniref:hypothetical protein n=1 Tax=Hyphomicrobium sp. MC8b TaxID=300273 RepID=UPI003919657B